MWDCVEVKEEAAWEGVSAAAAQAGLYLGHEVKQELLVSPEVLQPQDVAFSLRPNFDVKVTVVKEELSDVESDGIGNNVSSDQSGERFEDRCLFTRDSRELVSPCTVRLERIPIPLNKEQEEEGKAKNKHKILGPKLNKNYTHIDNSEEIDQIDLSNKMEIHSQKGRFTCDTCGLMFMLRKKIITHLQTCFKQASKDRYKKNTTPLSCKTCNKQFKVKAYLIIHERIHTGLKPYKCDICEKKYSQSSHLLRHKKSHESQCHMSTETHLCEICSKQYRSKYDLFIHKRIHTGQMPYICQCCGKRFNKKSTLINHEKTHAANRPYHCEVCNKQFAIKWNLTKHKRSHTNETPYVCDVCDKKFMHSYSLTKHKRKHTPKTNLQTVKTVVQRNTVVRKKRMN